MMDPSHESAREPATHQVLVLSSLGELFAVDLLRVREVRRWEGAARVPHSRACVRGVINVRGAVVPVVDLAQRLKGADASGDEGSVVVLLQAHLCGAERAVGLLVDGVDDVLDLDSRAVRPAPAATTDTELVAGLFSRDDNTVVLLAVEQLLSRVLPFNEADRA